MGIFNSLLFGGREKKQFRLCILGLAGAGKTSLTYRILHGSVIFTMPTIGLNYEIMEFPRFTLAMYDTGGQDKLRALWPYYIQGADVIWFLIDATDTQNMKESIDLMIQTLSAEEAGSACVAILLTKTDVQGCVTREGFMKLFSLDSIPQHQKLVLDISTFTYKNVDVLLDWTTKRCHIPSATFFASWITG